MNLYGRFIYLLVKGLFYLKKSDIFQSCQSHFWVNPLDLDLNFHMNNGRYLSIMDLGRLDLMLKARVFWPLLLRGYYPVVVTESIRFKKSLGPFQFFDLMTQIEAWDERNFYMVQTFKRQGEVYAVGYLKGRFKKRGVKETIPTADIFQLLGASPFSVKRSDLSKKLDLMDESLKLNTI